MARKKRQSITQQIMQEVRETQKSRAHDLTRKQYLQQAKRYVKFCRDSFNSKTFDDCRIHIQDYSNYLQNLGYCASTIHTYLAAACAVWNVKIESIDKPIRHVSEYIKGRKEKTDSYKVDINDPKWSYIVDFQRLVGLRRDELLHLKGNNFGYDESEHPCVIVERGKGGKMQYQRINREDENFIKAYFDNVDINERIFDMKYFKNDLNFHKLRAECAKKYYFDELEKINKDEYYAEKLEKEIRARWQKMNKRKNGTVKPFDKKEIRGYYVLKGKNRVLAKEKGMPLRYNKIALLATSVFKLSHWRNDVTVASYMLA